MKISYRLELSRHPSIVNCSMRFTPIIIFLVSILTAVPLYSQTAQSLGQLSITQLESRLIEINSRLDQLAHFSFRSGVGTNGDRSMWHLDANHIEWFQVDLPEPRNIDQITLILQLVIDSKKGLISDGFPKESQIYAGTAENPQG